MKKKIGWGMLGFLVFLLVCGLSMPIGIVAEWWWSVVFVGGVLSLMGFVHLAVSLTEGK